MMLKKYFFILVFLTSIFYVKSEEIISIPDTSFARGETINLLITNLAQINVQDSLEFYFEYNQFVIDIKNTSLSSNSVISGAVIEYNNDIYSSPAKLNVIIKGLSACRS